MSRDTVKSNPADGELFEYAGSFRGGKRPCAQLLSARLSAGIVRGLEKRGIQANSILKNEKLVPLFNESSHSIEDMQIWIRELIEFLASYSYETEKTPNIVRKLETYIEENLQEELTRSDLAAKVFLHPDYLSHIF